MKIENYPEIADIFVKLKSFHKADIKNYNKSYMTVENETYICLDLHLKLDDNTEVLRSLLYDDKNKKWVSKHSDLFLGAIDAYESFDIKIESNKYPTFAAMEKLINEKESFLLKFSPDHPELLL